MVFPLNTGHEGGYLVNDIRRKIESSVSGAQRKAWDMPRMNRLDAGDAESGSGIITETNTGSS